jgi:hypothetical protein
MTIRTRKLIGTVLFVAYSLFYYVFMISVALARLPGTGIGTQLLFYLIITVVWLIPAAVIVRWMQKPG